MTKKKVIAVLGNKESYESFLRDISHRYKSFREQPINGVIFHHVRCADDADGYEFDEILILPKFETHFNMDEQAMIWDALASVSNSDKKRYEYMAVVDSVMNETKTIERDVAIERRRQLLKWGIQNHDPKTFFCILAEEVGEISKAINDEDFSNYEDELVQTIAVAQQALAAFRRQELDRKAKAIEPAGALMDEYHNYPITNTTDEKEK